MASDLWHLIAIFLSIMCLIWSYKFVSRRNQPALDTTPGAAATLVVSGADNFADWVSLNLFVPAAASKVKQSYDAFLILDVEATCQRGFDFDYPNEIIEFPVCLMRWKDRDGDKASQLEVIEEFRSFVKPSWRPSLSEFCTELTGITQDQVDAAPEFPAVLRSFRGFLVKHRLIEKNGKRRLRFCWCSDGPFDIRDFVVKQCFISKMPIPDWMTGDVLDVRSLVKTHTSKIIRPIPRVGTLNIPAQLSVLGLSPFQGRQHSGIDDTRNIARIMTQLALEGVRLQPNTAINPRRRWYWMGKSQIIEENLAH
ncbi:ribonuclease H-like domain-containing protein [Mycena maculata]|uniref:Ribonuclease H-like domain-containing protein n=1 Tax=Mycena maculata TaxID=230809 RepID=A0AAD7HI38_9AGAR|nr:ribonuclease H-like domain-containing protein [Mycena maculata]